MWQNVNSLGKRYIGSSLYLSWNFSVGLNSYSSKHECENVGWHTLGDGLSH
jgi:hypothetical protein